MSSMDDDVNNLMIKGAAFVVGVYLCRKLFSPAPFVQGSSRRPDLMSVNDRAEICKHLRSVFEMCYQQNRRGLRDYNCDIVHDRLRHFCRIEYDPDDDSYHHSVPLWK